MTAHLDNTAQALEPKALNVRSSARRRSKVGKAAGATAAMTTVALMLAAALGAPVVRDEWISARSEAAAVQTLGGAAPLPWETGLAGDLCSTLDCPPRALAASGVQLLLQAQARPTSAARKMLIAKAQDRLARALAVRPSEGGWWAWTAYGQALDGADPRAPMTALAKSYAAAPFLAREGPWRVRYGAANWTGLSPSLRRSVIDEVVWLRDVNPAAAAAAVAAFVDPSASAALRQAWAARPPISVADRRSGSPGGVHLTR
jgi:hypothetical protein